MVPKLGHIWNESIRPTLTDLAGDGWLLSTPKGRNAFWQMHMRGLDETEEEWATWVMPTSANPYIDPVEIETARRGLPERVFAQEYLAQFLEDAGGVFRNVDNCVSIGRIAHDPRRPDMQHFMGIDLARYEDWTVITVLDEAGRQVYLDRFNQVSWERQIERIVDIAGIYQAQVWIDETGIGDPLTEQIRTRAWERHIDVMIEGFKFSSTSKEQLVNGLAIALEHNELDLLDAPIQKAELQAYQYELSPGGHLKMNAPEGMHDDIVIALGLAVWGMRQAKNILPVGISRLDEISQDEPADWLADENWAEVI
jgi:phage FluMu gp28-like protein